MAIDVETLRQAVDQAAKSFPNSAPSPIQQMPSPATPEPQSDSKS